MTGTGRECGASPMVSNRQKKATLKTALRLCSHRTKANVNATLYKKTNKNHLLFIRNKKKICLEMSMIPIFQNEISFSFAFDFSRLIRYFDPHITLCIISALSLTEQRSVHYMKKQLFLFDGCGSY